MTESSQLQAGDRLHTCLYDALAEAGIDIPSHASLPDGGLPIEDLPAVCARLGITPFSKGTVPAYVGEPLIVIYKTRPGWAHAEFTTDAREMARDKAVCAIIRIEERGGVNVTV